MIHYPLHFPVQVMRASGTQNQWLSTASVQGAGGELTCAIPPEFEGPGAGFSPEDFFALAVANCFVATFQVIAEKSKVQILSIGAKGLLSVDRDESGRPWMKKMKLEVMVDAGNSDSSRVLRVLEKTSQSCLVIHSIKTEVTFEFIVQPSA